MSDAIAPASRGALEAAGAPKSKRIEPPPAAVSRSQIDEGDGLVHPRRPLLPLALGAVVLIAVVWGGIRLFGVAETSQPAAEMASASPDATVREQSPELSGLPLEGVPGTASSDTHDDTRAAGGVQTPANARARAGSDARSQGNGKPLAKANLPANANTPSGAKLPPRANTPAGAKLSANAKTPTGAKVPANAKSPTNATVPANAKASLNGKVASKTPLAAGATGIHSAGVQEVLPDVPPRARRTIRGNVRVSVRVIVEQDGSVFAALAEKRGPSRYFERLAVDAAKQWTFPPADSADQRFMLVKFAFNREGTTAEAVTLN